MKIKIITDSTAEISPDLAAKYDITVASLEVIMDGVARKAVDVPHEEFYAHLNDCLKNKKPLPTTSQVTTYGFEQVLAPYANKEDTFVAVLTIAKEMSSTYRSAQMAIENLGMKNVHLFDTYIVTYGLGHLVLEVAKLAQQEGMSVERFVEEAEDLNSRIWMYMSIGDLRCLRAGGRLSASSMALGALMHVKPVAYIEKKVEVCAKVMGQGKANKLMVERVVAERDETLPICFGNAQANDIVEKYKSQSADVLKLTGDEVNLSMGPVVGTHSGPGCAGIAFFKKK